MDAVFVQHFAPDGWEYAPKSDGQYDGPAGVIMWLKDVMKTRETTYIGYQMQYKAPYQTKPPKAGQTTPLSPQLSGLNFPRFSLIASTLLRSSSNFLTSSACSSFFFSRSWNR